MAELSDLQKAAHATLAGVSGLLARVHADAATIAALTEEIRVLKEREMADKAAFADLQAKFDAATKDIEAEIGQPSGGESMGGITQ